MSLILASVLLMINLGNEIVCHLWFKNIVFRMHLVCNIEQDMDADLLEKGSLPKKKCGNIE